MNEELSGLFEGKVHSITVYHGSPEQSFVPAYGKGEDKHDYGKGFYTTCEIELAREWATLLSPEAGYVHKYVLEAERLSVLNFNEQYGMLEWLAVLSKHRSAVSSKRDRNTEKKLIDRYYPREIEEADVVVGYRADDSFFSFAKQAIRGDVDITLLDTIFKEGGLGYQVFIQSRKAFDCLTEVDKNDKGFYEEVNYALYLEKYNARDNEARKKVADLIESDMNTLTDTIDKYL